MTTDRITLSATEEEETIGTITGALDGRQVMSADYAFTVEMARDGRLQFSPRR